MIFFDITKVQRTSCNKPVEKLDFDFLCATGQCYKYKMVSLPQCLRGYKKHQEFHFVLCLDANHCNTQV